MSERVVDSSLTSSTSSSTSPPVLSCQGLRVQYGGSVALNAIDLALGKGRMLGVLGANGAGKSSLVNALAGWSRGAATVSGRVELDGRDISRLAAHRRVKEGLLLVPEGRNVFGSLTVEQNLRLVTPPADTAGRFVLDLGGVYELFPRLRHKGMQLSGGERQMLAIGCALLAGPKALLLDEPSIGLAPMLVVDILARIRSLVDAGLSVLLVEQNAQAAMAVVDDVIVLERGTRVLQGSAADFRSDERIAMAYLGGSADMGASAP
jgi:branched-chain amino acid transport system ATP-binding protein